MRLTDASGALEVTGGAGALLYKGFGRATVSLKGADASHLKGDGWTLILNPGWTFKPGPRPGDVTLRAAPRPRGSPPRPSIMCTARRSPGGVCEARRA